MQFDLSHFMIFLGLVASMAVGVFMALVEASLLSMKPSQIARLSQRNPRLGQPLEVLLQKPQRLLSIIVIGTTFAYFVGTLCAWVLMRDLWPMIPKWVVFLVISLILMIVMEVIPKTIALQQPVYVSRKIASPTRRLLVVLRPLRRLLETITFLIRRILIPDRKKSAETLSQDEFETMIEEGKSEGLIKESESLMIQGIVRLGDKMVKDLMTPMVDVEGVKDDWATERILLSLRKMRHRSVPVFDESRDCVVGMLNSKKFIADRGHDLVSSMEPPIFIPETMKALSLLKQFITRRQRVAIVVDEFGSNSGLITEGDIHEEIFGEVEPDFDRREWLIEKIAEGRYLVDGTTRLDEISQETGFDLEEEGIDTIGGLLQVHLENNVKVGDTTEKNGVQITALKVARNRVLRAMLESDQAGPETDAATTTEEDYGA
ncbi:hemolysin family protein [Oscillatoria amoena NRMC-F 0135]|nr:hemolysin family protein [Oscillatoria amoena NRMC-F 0135]